MITLGRQSGAGPRFAVIGLRGFTVCCCAWLLLACAVAPPVGDAVVPAPTPVSAASVQVPPKRPPAIGLALGGGAARGFAHVGVIQVLEESGIRPTIVAGTSAGSLVAAIFASGKTGLQLSALAESMEEAGIADWTLPFFGRGLLRGEALARYVNMQVGGRPMESFPLALGIVATDLHSGQGVLFRRGDAGVAVRASSAVPAIFQPVKIAGREYVDGGLVSPVPVRYAREMGAELVIAVDISSSPEGNRADDTVQVVLQTFTIMGKSINAFELRDADIVVRPALAAVTGADFGARRLAIEAGRQAMLRMLPKLQAAIEAKMH